MIGRLLWLAFLCLHSTAQVTFQKQVLTSQFFAEGAAVADFDRDGELDIAAGPYWYAGPDFGAQREIYTPVPLGINDYSDSFFAFAHDLDADGWQDLLMVGFPGSAARWYRNPRGAPGHWPVHVVFDEVDGESPTFTDLTGDGRPELVCFTRGFLGYVEPVWASPAQPWTFHRISGPDTGETFTHGLGVGDVDGDGRRDVLWKSGWWRQPPSLAGDPIWAHHPVAFGTQGGAQMHVYDVDGDGDGDVITSLTAHQYGLAWFEHEQVGTTITFERHLIMADQPLHRRDPTFSQMHAVALADIDGDGLSDIVTGKRFWAHNGGDPGANDPAVLYWFRLKRLGQTVIFEPHAIDMDSGVGTQVLALDVTGDGKIDVVAANKKGTAVHVRQ